MLYPFLYGFTSILILLQLSVIGSQTSLWTTRVMICIDISLIDLWWKIEMYAILNQQLVLWIQNYLFLCRISWHGQVKESWCRYVTLLSFSCHTINTLWWSGPIRCSVSIIKCQPIFIKGWQMWKWWMRHNAPYTYINVSIFPQMRCNCIGLTHHQTNEVKQCYEYLTRIRNPCENNQYTAWIFFKYK